MNGGGRLYFPGLANFYATMEPIAYTITRVVFGWIMIMHGLPKWNRGIDGVGNAFATNYGLPRWFAALNPAVLFLLTTLFEWVPAPLGGPLVIGAGNLVFLVFFAASTALPQAPGQEGIAARTHEAEDGRGEHGEEGTAAADAQAEPPRTYVDVSRHG